MRSIENSSLKAWVRQRGFAMLVGLAVIVAAYVAWNVEVPSEVPDFALQAAFVYRVEVGAATFLGLYLVAMAFVLALNNRGFSEIGVSGVKAQDIDSNAHQSAIAEHQRQLEMLWVLVKMLRDPASRSRKETFCRPDG
jgi:hypothetical protein